VRAVEAMGLLHIRERRRPGMPGLPNVVRILDAAWRAWLRLRGGCKVRTPRILVSIQRVRKGAKQIAAPQSAVFMSTPAKVPAGLIGVEGWKFLGALIAAPDWETFEGLMNAAGKPRTRAFDRYVLRLEAAWEKKKRRRPRKSVGTALGRPRGSHKHPPKVRALAKVVVNRLREERMGKARLPVWRLAAENYVEKVVRDEARRHGMKLNSERLRWLCNVAPKTGRFKT
jgi:hypothetical protein